MTDTDKPIRRRKKGLYITQQRLRSAVSIALLIIVIIPPTILFFMQREGRQTAIGIYSVSIIMPSLAFVAASLKSDIWRAAGKRRINRTAASIGMVMLGLSCVLILGGFLWIAFWRTEIRLQTVKGFDKPAEEVVPYPIDQGVREIAQFFGSLLTTALAFDIFSVSIPKPEEQDR